MTGQHAATASARPVEAGGLGHRNTWRPRNVRYAWRFRRLVPKILRNTWKAKRGARILRGVEFALTYDCNFSCSHCLRDDLIGPRPVLSTDEVVEAARQIEGLGGIFINFTGGEPLLRPDIFEIVERTAAIPGLIVTLASNAFILDRDKARELKRRGLAMLTLSLDGPDAATHDTFRNRPGSFDRVLSAVEHAHAEGLEVWLNAVARADLLREGKVRDMAELVRRLDGLLTLNLPYPVGGWAGKSVELTAEEYAEYLEALRLPWVRWEGSSNWTREGCPAGAEKLYLTPYGDVFPCAVIQTSYGNVRTEPLTAIYGRMGGCDLFTHCRKGCLVAEEPERLAAVEHAAVRTVEYRAGGAR